MGTDVCLHSRRTQILRLIFSFRTTNAQHRACYRFRSVIRPRVVKVKSMVDAVFARFWPRCRCATAVASARSTPPGPEGAVGARRPRSERTSPGGEVFKSSSRALRGRNFEVLRCESPTARMKKDKEAKGAVCKLRAVTGGVILTQTRRQRQ